MIRQYAKRMLLFATLCVGIITAVPATVSAADPFAACNDTKAANTTLCKDAASNSGDTLFGAGGLWSRIISLILRILGAIAVIVIIVGGIRYTLSSGDPSSAKAAKDTILYALIGLVIAVVADLIITFVLGRI